MTGTVCTKTCRSLFPGASNASSQAEVCGHAYLTETEQKKQPLPKEGLACVFVSAEAVAPDAPPETYAFAVCCLFLITNSVPTTSAAPMMRQITAFCTKPATMNITKEIAATVAAYGICVFTWVRCSH